MARGPGSSLSLILVAVTGLSAAYPAHAASEPNWQLENGRLSASISPCSAAIVSVERAGAQTSYVNPASAPEIVRLQVPIGLWNGHSALGSEAGGVKVRRPSRDSLSDLRKVYSDGILLTEGANDLVNPFADGAYTWNQSRAPAVLAYSLPWSVISNDVEALDYEAANIAFSYRMLLNLIVDGGEGSVARYPEFAQHLLTLQKLKSAAAPYYSDAEFRDHDGLSDVGGDAGTVTAVYVSPTNTKMGIVLANLTGKAATARFSLPAQADDLVARMFSTTFGERQIKLSGQQRFSLAPHEIVILGIDANLPP